jgi:hypothetical protein
VSDWLTRRLARCLFPLASFRFKDSGGCLKKQWSTDEAPRTSTAAAGYLTWIPRETYGSHSVQTCRDSQQARAFLFGCPVLRVAEQLHMGRPAGTGGPNGIETEDNVRGANSLS